MNAESVPQGKDKKGLIRGNKINTAVDSSSPQVINKIVPKNEPYCNEITQNSRIIKTRLNPHLHNCPGGCTVVRCTRLAIILNINRTDCV